MRARSGGRCATEGHCYSSARLLVGGGGVSPAAAMPAPSPPSLDSEHARLEKALCATTAMLFVASVSYVALSSLFACFRAARRPQRPDAEHDALETKRALEEIPVVVMHVGDDPVGGRGREGGVEQEEDEAAGEECAVCLAEYASGEEVRVLPACRHGFHRECVDRWLLTRAPTCPVCRAPVAATSEGLLDAKGCATGDAVLPVVVVAGL